MPTLTSPTRPGMTLLLASVASLTLTGCDILQKEGPPVPVSDTRWAKPIQWACDGPDAANGKARQGIIEHNSRLASVKAGKKVVYSDDCQEKPTS